MIEILYQNETDREVVFRSSEDPYNGVIHYRLQTCPDDLVAECEREYQRLTNIPVGSPQEEISEEV